MKRLLFTLSIILISSLAIQAQKNIGEAVKLYRDSVPQEKIYLHMDKSYYNPGETIWFKAYIFNGLGPSAISKNFYAELLNSNGEVIKKLAAPVIEAGSMGSFDLPSNLVKPLVYIRAYTTSMMNTDTAFFYMKAVRIITTGTDSKTAVLMKPVIKFMPEGGDWVNGIASVVAFKATNQFDEPVNVSGHIAAQGKKIADFTTKHDGMGSITLTPQAGQVYTAHWKDMNGKNHTDTLPQCKTTGITFKVIDEDGKKRMYLSRSVDVDASLQTLQIVACMNQQVIYAAKANLSKETTTTGLIPTDQFPTGILQLTVFDANMRPVAERITFVNNNDFEFLSSVYFTKKDSSRRALNKVEIMVDDTVRSNMSISVTDADLNTTTKNDENVISRMLLTGDLRGKIANPYYYFANDNDSTRFYLDLVMLTHGWRKYNWENVLAGKLPANRKEESDFLVFRGNVYGINPSNFPRNTMMTAFLQKKDSSTQFVMVPMDSKGGFEMSGLLFFGDMTMFYQVGGKDSRFAGTLLRVENGLWKGYEAVTLTDINRMQDPLPDKTVVAKNMQLNKEALQNEQIRKKREKTLQEVVVKAKAPSATDKLDDQYSSGMFKTGDAISFDVATDPFAAGARTVLQYLQGKVAGMMISGNPGNEQVSWRGGQPGFFLDEMSVDMQQLANINMNDVAYIKVFRPPFMGGFNGANGAIAVYLKKGGQNKNSDVKGLEKIVLHGYNEFKQFFSPNYATASPMDDISDTRTTLYWQPYILLDKNNRRFSFQFYNSDNTRRFRIIMEGVDEEGKLSYIEKVF